MPARNYPKGSTKPEPLPDTGSAAGKRKCKGDHYANFNAAVRSRQQSDLNADILEGHYSSALCHVANISYRLGTMVPFSAQSKAFGDNKEACDTLARMEEHLKENNVTIDGLDYRLGRKLTIDAKTETFVGDPEASAMLTRNYRKPFVVPTKVS